MDFDLDAIESRANAATPGPWLWAGNVDNHTASLMANDWAWGQTVMTFQRWGMQGAQPVFAVDHLLTRPMQIPGGVRFQVCPEATTRDDPRVYRGDFRGINHPDAEFIAAAREDIPALIARIRELEAALAEREAAP